MLARFCKWVLKLFGWRLDICLPETRKIVLVVAPHTSNWDFMVGILTRFSTGIKMNFLGKSTLFRKPYGWIFSGLGGIPVIRSSSHDLVDQLVVQFNQRDQLYLALAPEGSRSKTPYWKTGFYYIAYKANVPILMVSMDYGKKEISMREHFMPTGEIHQDMKIIKNFFRHVKGKNPELQSEIRIPDNKNIG